MTRDYKSVGMPRHMSPAGVNFCLALVGFIAVLTAYGLVDDVTERRVVLTQSELDQRIRDARIQAAQEAFTAANEDGQCFLNWRSNPKAKPGTKSKGIM